MSKFIDARTVVNLINSGDWVLFGGSGGGHGVPESIIESLANRFSDTDEPRDLTLVSVVSLGDWDEQGFNQLTLPGLAERVISSGFINSPKFADLTAAEEIEAYLFPQGVLSQLCRDMAAGRPGLLTKTGLHTYADPRLEGGKQNQRSKEDFVKLVTIDGEEFLLYRSLPVDVGVIRGTTADEKGNITTEEEPYAGEILSIATAVRRRGGIVIAQVKRLAQADTLPGKLVKVPGALVDYVVEMPDQPQTYTTYFNPAYAGIIRQPSSSIPDLPLDIRKVIARRGAMELAPGDLVNLGYGIANGISTVAVEEGFVDEVTLTIEQGIFGGITAGGMDAGAGVNFDAIIEQSSQFDFYDGGGLDIAFLSFAQVDSQGNVNVSSFGKGPLGPGGFVNISQGTKRVIFVGTLTTGGLEIVPNGQIGVTLTKEGRIRKWVPQVKQITFSGQYALELGQEIYYFTDRGVFQLLEEGITLIEIANGIDLESDVLDQIEFPVCVSPELKKMDPRLFQSESMGILEEFRNRVRNEEEKLK